jgi:hypothetical protein
MASRTSACLKRFSATLFVSLFTMASSTLAVAADAPPAHSAAHARGASTPMTPHKKKKAKRRDPKKPQTKSTPAPKSDAALPTLSHARRVEPTRSPARAKKTKKSASRAASKKGSAAKSGERAPRARRAARSDASHRRACAAHVLSIDRNGLEGETLELTDCAGNPTLDARKRLSILARPWSAALPDVAAMKAHSKGVPLGAELLAPGIRLLDEGLAVRLNAMAAKFPGLTLSLVSGYRPDSRGSLHQSGRAIDVRATGASNQELAAFCRTLQDTGCGYYPNGMFLHIDVRKAGSGNASWIDASGPGEPPHYVSEWPPRAAAVELAPPTKPYDQGHSDG